MGQHGSTLFCWKPLSRYSENVQMCLVLMGAQENHASSNNALSRSIFHLQWFACAGLLQAQWDIGDSIGALLSTVRAHTLVDCCTMLPHCWFCHNKKISMNNKVLTQLQPARMFNLTVGQCLPPGTDSFTSTSCFGKTLCGACTRWTGSEIEREREKKREKAREQAWRIEPNQRLELK